MYSQLNQVVLLITFNKRIYYQPGVLLLCAFKVNTLRSSKRVIVEVNDWQKSMCLAAVGAVAVAGCKTLACVLANFFSCGFCI